MLNGDGAIPSSAHLKGGKRCYNQNISLCGKIEILILYPSLQSFVSIGFQLVDGLGSTEEKHATKCPGQKRCPRYADQASPVQLGDISKIHVTVDMMVEGLTDTYYHIVTYIHVTALAGQITSNCILVQRNSQQVWICFHSNMTSLALVHSPYSLIHNEVVIIIGPSKKHWG